MELACHCLFMKVINSIKSFFSKAKFIPSFFNKVYDFFPTALPVGLAELNAWTDSIIKTYEFPDNDSIRFSLAVMVLHLPSTDAYKPKRFFALSVHKAMANQVASQVIQDLKAKQDAEKKAAQQKSAEVTTASQVTNNDAIPSQVLPLSEAKN